MLENRHVHSYLLALCALYFVKSSGHKISSSRDISGLLGSVDWSSYISIVKGFELKLPRDFDTFEKKVIDSLEYVLDVKKGVAEAKNEKWLSKDSDNWLKRDDSYAGILGIVERRLTSD
jgi:hypothetical protein